MDDSPICIHNAQEYLLDPRKLPATGAADQCVVLGFIEVGIRWVDRLWAYLVERDHFGSPVFREEAKAMID